MYVRSLLSHLLQLRSSKGSMTTFTPANRISASRFTWEKFCGKAGWSQTDLVSNAVSAEEWKPRSEWRIVGWCPATELRVRARLDGIAVLLENRETFEEVWLHWQMDMNALA